MRIERLWIKKYGVLEDFHLHFSSTSPTRFGDLALTLLVGENGTGKTTLFRFLVEWITGRGQKWNAGVVHLTATQSSVASDADLPSKVIVSSYSPADGFSSLANISEPEQDAESNAEFVYLGQDYAALKQLDSLSSSRTLLSLIRSIYSDDHRRQRATSLLLDYIGYAGEPVIEMKRVYSQVVSMCARDLTKEDHPWYIREQREELLKIQPAVHRLESFYSTMKRQKDPSTHRRRWINVTRLQLDEEYPGGFRAWIADAQLMVDSPVAHCSVVRDVAFPKGSSLISTRLFSSGERALLFRFFGLIRAVTDYSLVLIDEPETHLHPRWINQFVATLVAVLGEYKAHVIIASHSPQIAADLPSECIIGLKTDQQGRVSAYSIDEQSLGGDPRGILEDVFGVDQYLGKFTREFIAEIDALLDACQVEAAERLFRLLATSDEKFRLFRRIRELKTGER